MSNPTTITSNNGTPVLLYAGDGSAKGITIQGNMKGGRTKLQLSRDGGATFFDAFPFESTVLQSMLRYHLVTVNSNTSVYATLVGAGTNPSVSIYVD
jgi:hypothetical protein